MRYLSLFSGVEAASVAWMRYGWEPLAFAEIDAFPSAVLANRFPDVPNLGDVCKVDWEEFYGRYGAVELLVGGSPCTSFSIAGNREGLKGESRLMFEYIRAIRDLVRASGGKYPRYIVWENVPGCLSSNKGRDFGCLLDALEDCGFGLAWRTMDAQYARVPDGSPGGFFGPVAQRRRRVFLVGVLGSPNAAEILFERQSLRGDNPPSREARKRLAGDSEEGPGARGGAGCLTPWDNESKRVQSADGVMPTLYAGEKSGQRQQAVMAPVSASGFCRGNSPAAGSIGYQDEMSPTLRAGESGTNMVPGVITAGFKWYAGAKARGIGYEDGTSPTIAVSDSHVPAVLTPWDVQSKRIMSPSGTSPSLPSGTGEGMNIQPCVMQPVVSVSTANTNSNGSNINEEGVSYTLDGANSNAVAFAQNSRDEVRYVGEDGSVIGALAAQPGMKQTSYVMTDVTSRGAVEEGMVGTITAHAKAVDCRNLELKEDVSGTLQAKENGGYSLNYQNPVMLKVRCGSDTYEKPDGKIGTAGKGALMSEDVAFTIAASQDQTLIEPNEYVVRRLTPVECERLQGFPDGWTDLAGCDVEEITRKVAEALGYEEGSKEFKKLQRDVSKWSKDCPDTPRYKAMGNSIATPCLMWIGQRIEAFDILHYDEVGL